jgi:hypothetical protein
MVAASVRGDVACMLALLHGCMCAVQHDVMGAKRAGAVI